MACKQIKCEMIPYSYKANVVAELTMLGNNIKPVKYIINGLYTGLMAIVYAETPEQAMNITMNYLANFKSGCIYQLSGEDITEAEFQVTEPAHIRAKNGIKTLCKSKEYYFVIKNITW